jgi:hypothetical protein
VSKLSQELSASQKYLYAHGWQRTKHGWWAHPDYDGLFHEHEAQAAAKADAAEFLKLYESHNVLQAA